MHPDEDEDGEDGEDGEDCFDVPSEVVVYYGSALQCWLTFTILMIELHEDWDDNGPYLIDGFCPDATMAMHADATALPSDSCATVNVLTSLRPSAASDSGICCTIHAPSDPSAAGNGRRKNGM